MNEGNVRKVQQKLFAHFRDGDRVDMVVGVLSRSIGKTKTGKDFLSFQVLDANGAIMRMKRWDCKPDEIAASKKVAWARVRGEVVTFNDALEIKASAHLVAVNEPTDSHLYLPPPPVPVDVLRERLGEYIASVRSVPLRALLRSVLIEDVNLAVPFELMPAAVSMHHAYRHGLLQHTLEVTDAVDAIATKHQRWGTRRVRFSRDLAVTGALLHDIGKLEEYEEQGLGVDVSDDGLIGHTSLGVLRIARKIAQLRKRLDFPQALERLVLHMIESHHGKQEFGAPVPPMFAEAALVHHGDMISAEFCYFAEAVESAADGEIWFKQKKLNGRKVYVRQLDCVWGDQTIPASDGTGETIPVSLLPYLPAVTDSHVTSRPSIPRVRLVVPGMGQNFATVRVPLVGKIAAGTPILDSENIEDDVEIEAGSLGIGRGEYFMLRVQGDSMTGDGIEDGDLILVRSQEQAEWNDLVVAQIDGEGATVKRLISRDESVVLQPSNPAHAPIVVNDPERLSIRGRVIAVAR